MIGWLVQRWRSAAAEDARWREAARELGPSAVEVVGLDTRLLRPWGESAAHEMFVLAARSKQQDWLEPLTEGLQEHAPEAIRALAGALDGVKVAFVSVRPRSGPLICKRAALGPAGLVVEAAPGSNAPPAGFVRDLEALARRAKETP